MKLRVPVPHGFSFRRTVLSHGWYALAPFRAEGDGGALGTTLGGPQDARAVRWSMDGQAVLAESSGRASTAERRHLARVTQRVFGLDVDLRPFHAMLRADPGLAWVAASGSGRMLRAPTAFEDLVKLVLTTNCSWAFTTKMVRELVERYGAPAADGSRAFPSAAALARVDERELRDRVRMGYRAPLVARLAREVAAGATDPEAWDRDRRETAELKRELLRLPGVGPYVAENVLKLLGRPGGLALDSWLRAEYSRAYHGGRPVRDRTIARRYARFGEWNGLALWCDMTRDWLDGRRPASLAPAAE